MPHCKLHVAAALAACVAISTGARAQTPAAWKLTETLRIGGGDIGPTSFNAITSIAVDAKGRIFVYDRQAKEIRVFGADGKFVKTIGRLGSGPGELRDAEGIAFTRDGTLWMRDAANARFTVFNSEGVYQHGWTMTFCFSQGAWNPQMDRGGRLLDVDCMVKNGYGGASAILGYHLDRSRIDTIADMPACGTRELFESSFFVMKRGSATINRGIPHAPQSMTALGPSGEVWCVSNSASYSIARIVPGSRDTMQVTRRIPPIPLSAAERDTIIRNYGVGGPDGMEMSRVAKVRPAIDRIVADEDGRLWVVRSAANGTREVDVIDAKGRAIGTISLGKMRTFDRSPFIVRGDDLYLVVLDQDDVPFVTRHHITR